MDRLSIAFDRGEVTLVVEDPIERDVFGEPVRQSHTFTLRRSNPRYRDELHSIELDLETLVQDLIRTRRPVWVSPKEQDRAEEEERGMGG